MDKIKEISINNVMKTIETMRQCPQHTFFVLTKRPKKMLRYLKDVELPPNFCAGTTVENQQRADERIPILLQIPAAVRFVSCTLIEPIDFTYKGLPIKCPQCNGTGEITDKNHPMHPNNTGDGENETWCLDCNNLTTGINPIVEGIDMVIIECERLAGNRAGRGCEDEGLWWQWARDIKEQCRAAGVAVWMKQGPILGKVVDDITKFPKDMRLRQYPK